MTLRIVALVSVTVVLLAPRPLPAQPVADIQAEWPGGAGLQKVSAPQQARFTIVGPGRLEVRVVQDPYRNAGRALFDPVAWRNYDSTATNTATWMGLTEAIEGRCGPPRYLQSGKAVASLVENVAAQYDVACEVGPGEHHLGVRLEPPAQRIGGGWTQWIQQARVVVRFERQPGNPNRPEPRR